MTNKKTLLKSAFAMKVRRAWKTGDLTRWNIGAWVTEYNGGFYDEILHKEVTWLLNHFEGENEPAVIWGVYDK